MTTEPISVAPVVAPFTSYAPTPSQVRLWFLQRLGQDSLAAHVAVAFLLRGPLDVAALERVVTFVAECNPALRTLFLDRDGGPRAELCSAAPPLRIDALPTDTEEVCTAW